MSSISWRTERKGYWFFKEGKILRETDTDKRTHFSINGDNDKYSVIYDKIKKQWSCDCQFFSLKLKKCSHVIACEYLQKEENNLNKEKV